jgi:hypothetical protein
VGKPQHVTDRIEKKNLNYFLLLLEDGENQQQLQSLSGFEKKNYLLLPLGNGEENDGQIKGMGKERVNGMNTETILLLTLTNHVAAGVVVVVVVDHYLFIYFLNRT